MTRKHYNQIAKILGEATKWEHSPEWITSALIALMVEDNPRFDRTKFLEAIKKEATKWTD